MNTCSAMESKIVMYLSIKPEYGQWSTSHCKYDCVAPFLSLVLFIHCLTRNLFLLSSNFSAFSVYRDSLSFSVLHSIHLCKIHSMFGNLPEYLHRVPSTASFKSLCVPFKYLEVWLAMLSKLRHLSQQLCLRGIFPFNLHVWASNGTMWPMILVS